jgi:hypothetical protein
MKAKEIWADISKSDYTRWHPSWAKHCPPFVIQVLKAWSIQINDFVDYSEVEQSRFVVSYCQGCSNG